MKLLKITHENQIPDQYMDTPIKELLMYQNLGVEFKEYATAQMLVGMCMDNRKQLRIPENFAYIIRTGGANLRYSQFTVSYAIAIGGIKHIALIAHNHCGMVNLISKRDRFVEGLSQNAGWDTARVNEHFMNYAPMFEIDNEADFVIKEAKRMEAQYNGIMVVPLYYTVEDNQISLLLE